MPTAPGKQCPGYGSSRGLCGNIVKSSGTYCSSCRSKRKQASRLYDRERNKHPGRQFLHSKSWRKLRLVYLADHPLCEQCLRKSGRIEAAVLVHHLDGNQLHNDPANLMALCNSCHEIIHGRKNSVRP